MFTPSEQQFIASYSGLGGGKTLANSVVILPISAAMPNQNQEGERFLATLRRVAMDKVNSIKIVIADTLYRHTPQHAEGSEEEIRKKTRSLGDKWQERNLSSVKKLQAEFSSISIEVIHWDEYIEDKNYSCHLETIEEEYKVNEHLQGALIKTARQFLLNHANNATAINQEIDLNKPLYQNLAYLKEECAMLGLWKEKYDPDYILYPSKATDAIVAGIKKFLPKTQYLTAKITEKKQKNEIPFNLPMPQTTATVFYTPSEREVKAHKLDPRVNSRLIMQGLEALGRGIFVELCKVSPENRDAASDTAALYTAKVFQELYKASPHHGAENHENVPA